MNNRARVPNFPAYQLQFIMKDLPTWISPMYRRKGMPSALEKSRPPPQAQQYKYLCISRRKCCYRQPGCLMMVSSWSIRLLVANLAITGGVAGGWRDGKFKTLVTFGDSYTDENRLGYFINNNGSAPPVAWQQPVVSQNCLEANLQSLLKITRV